MKKHIVVIGGGFAGVSAIKELLKHKKELEITITLIDKNAYHLFTPSLYEVATSEVPQKNIAIPFSEIFGNQITFMQSAVERIDDGKKIVITKDKEISYDYLILCAGSVPAYHHIPGLLDYSLSLKSASDALMIKNKIKTLCCKEGQCEKKVTLLIGGGGFSGTELAAELLTYKDKLAKQYHLAKECLDITIVQGSNRLLTELDSHVSRIAQKRLSGPDIHFAFGGHIKEVTQKNVLTDAEKIYPYDLLIWTGGVEANSLGLASKLPINKRNQVIVDDFLQVTNTIFAAGDIAGFVETKTQNSVPNVAQVAEEQGKVAGENVYRLLANKHLTVYTFRHFGYIVPLKGRFAAAELIGNLHVDGFFGWVLQQLVFLRYLLTILPIWKAIKRWNTFETQLQQ